MMGLNELPLHINDLLVHGRLPTLRKKTRMEVLHLNQKQPATRWGVSGARSPRWRGVVPADLDQEPWRAGECKVNRVAFCR
jgi:hypothetical protein